MLAKPPRVAFPPHNRGKTCSQNLLGRLFLHKTRENVLAKPPRAAFPPQKHGKTCSQNLTSGFPSTKCGKTCSQNLLERLSLHIIAGKRARKTSSGGFPSTKCGKTCSQNLTGGMSGGLSGGVQESEKVRMAKSLRHPPRDRIPAFRAWLPGKALPRNPVAARGSSAGGARWLQVICEANDAGDSGRKEARRKVCEVAPFRQRIPPLTALARDGRVGAADGRRRDSRRAADGQRTGGGRTVDGRRRDSRRAAEVQRREGGAGRAFRRRAKTGR